MNITGGEKVTLNPKNKDERIALSVLQLATGHEGLEELLTKYRGTGEGNLDCTINPSEHQGVSRKGFLSIFDDDSKYDIVSIVFRYKEKV